MSTTAVDVVDVHYSYGDFSAVDGVSFSVERGEFFALLGTNGAGKTTLLETIEGHRNPSAGTVRVFGNAPTDRRRTRRRMGVMLQESGFAADLTVRESVALFGRLSGRVDDVDAVLDRVELRRSARTRVAQLSGGEKRRLDFAAAVFGAPELLVLDEPTTGLDPESRDRMWAIVDDLRKRGTTVLLTTHYLEEAEQYADRVALMHSGRLRSVGGLDDLVAEHPSTISFTTSADLTRCPVVTTDLGEGRRELRSSTVQPDLTRLLQWADHAGAVLTAIEIAPSGLRDLFTEIAAEGENR